ncbi:kinesin-like protein KIF23 isoform X2 [Neocloeon triangulifer]|uniref:kinesin-like protein KIF23 isoform X2 n=1 Tax=Neocloeon triangulifer TaxID=2078957 RepID=UPI00286F4C3C|nr:kinesin-like protein KIF23 isoform X2 [Neocloeon triangulifer]
MKPSRVIRTPGKKTPSRNNSREKLVIKDPVEVYCRIRPVSVIDDGYIKVIDERTIQLATPDSSIGNRGTYKEIQYKFSRVFDPEAQQKDVFEKVALPLVDNFLKGLNGLLFTYGVTGSGKTFTMTGTPQDSGILPRALDVIFNSISGCQARKFTFKPDRMNGFDIQADVDAAKERQHEIIASVEVPIRTRLEYPKTPRKRLAQWETATRIAENTRLSISDEDFVYSVFVTYVEIYNNCVYDLLDEPADDMARLRHPQPRLVREDGSRTMYVHGVHEVEVTSANEAFEVFCRGMKRKTTAHTVLNAESSRSHAIFSIRLVKAPYDSNGEEILQNKEAITISQLSLVDLAGSERTNRSKTQGQRLKEAGNINNSLLTLRMCFEILRENQMNAGNGAPKMVPFRDSRLTHLFKSFFDGEGKVRMVVCVNPNPNDYEETLHVMKFAEMSQEVQVTRIAPTPKRPDINYTPGRRRANQIFKEAAKRLEETGASQGEPIPFDLGIVYSLGLPIPTTQLTDPNNEEIIRSVMMVLESRLAKRRCLQQQYKSQMDQVRSGLVSLERENISLKQENASLRASLEQERAGRSILEQKLVESEGQLVAARLNSEGEREEIRKLNHQNEDLMLKLNQKKMDSERTKQRMQDKMLNEKERVAREMRSRFLAEQSNLKMDNKEKEEKLRQVRQIVDGLDKNAPNRPTGRVTRLAAAKSDADLSTSSVAASSANARNAFTPNPKRGPAVSNPRHRRSRSACGNERWLDHKPQTASSKFLELQTIFQPNMPRRKSVTKLTDPKDVTDPSTSKYCLTTQEQDSEGELETKLYKGDVLPTVGGGAQVVLTDVEVLKQASPTSPRLSPTRKRSANGNCKENGKLQPEEVTERCKTGIEGHSKRSCRK